MQMTTLGRGGPVVSRAGLGLMGMSGIYGQADDQESIATIHAALDAGITLLDTGDFYGMGHNELRLAQFTTFLSLVVRKLSGSVCVSNISLPLTGRS